MKFVPISEEEATELAQQVQVLANPGCLRFLALLVGRADYDVPLERAARLLDESHENVMTWAEQLLRAGLATSATNLSGDVSIAPSAAAWVRFSALLGSYSHSGSTHPAVSTEKRLQPVPGASAVVPDADQEVPEVLQRIALQLSERFARTFSAETVTKYVFDTYVQLRERAKIDRLLPSLTSRFAADRLTALATARGISSRSVPEVLFVCVRNSGRSQMAASILNYLAGDRIRVRSAGSGPVDTIDETVVAVLDEIGCSVIGEYPKPLTDEVVQASDIVVTMGCGDACPVYSGRRYLDWKVSDPRGQDLDAVRAIRDDVYRHVESLVRDMLS